MRESSSTEKYMAAEHARRPMQARPAASPQRSLTPHKRDPRTYGLRRRLADPPRADTRITAFNRQQFPCYTPSFQSPFPCPSIHSPRPPPPAPPPYASVAIFWFHHARQVPPPKQTHSSKTNPLLILLLLTFHPYQSTSLPLPPSRPRSRPTHELSSNPHIMRAHTQPHSEKFLVLSLHAHPPTPSNHEHPGTHHPLSPNL